MKTVKASAIFRQVMRDHSYKMEQNETVVTNEDDCDNSEVVSKNGDSLLISLVQNYPHLYVKTSKNQNDYALREKSWQEIATILEQPASECLKRWTRLRERYSKEKRLSEQNMRNGVTFSIRQCWPHYAEMGFLAQHIVGRRSYRNINTKAKDFKHMRKYKSEIPSPSDNSSLSPSPAQQYTATLLVQSPVASPSTSTAIVESPDSLSLLASENKRISSDQNEQRFESVEESIAEMATTVTNHLRNTNQQQETSEDLFCKYLASELKKMSEEEKKATTRRLMDALFQGNT
ncbi:transcription factor Adf-1-like [Diprion similis]|uniref:transcription factor Adf-1-like n=1 Tax=Diprion similis TaxID=362088 RepID=UPI001EF9ACF3|nr:transcription factor Adf-1-like [Diprion similis]